MVIFFTKILDIAEAIISAKNGIAGGAGLQSDLQLSLFSILADSQMPLLLQLQSKTQLSQLSPPSKSHTPLGQVEETVTPTLAESVTAKTKLLKIKLFEKSRTISIIVVDIFTKHFILKITYSMIIIAVRLLCECPTTTSSSLRCCRTLAHIYLKALPLLR